MVPQPSTSTSRPPVTNLVGVSTALALPQNIDVSGIAPRHQHRSLFAATRG